MISTSTMSGTGFMKCMPITWPGRSVTAPSFVIEIEEVLEARMHEARQPVQFAEDLGLGLHLLDDGLHHQVGAGRGSQVGGARDPAQGRVLVGGADLAFLYQLREALADALEGPVQDGLIQIPQGDLVTGLAKTCAMPLPMVPPPRTATLSAS